MQNETSELFALAAKFFLKKHKESGESQKEIANELGVTQAYLSSVMNGSRSASFNLYSQVAKKLYGPLDKFLAVGRRIKEGRKPLTDEQENQNVNDVEHLIARLTYYVLDHKRIENEIDQLKHFYESIIENLQSAILVTDNKNKVVYANKRMENICGITPSEVIGRSPFNIEKSIPGLQIYPFVQKYIEACEQLTPLYFENIPVATPRGDSHYNSGWIIPLLKDGAFDGMICTLRDTSDSHALFNLLTEAVEKIQEAMVIVQQKAPGVIPTAFFANSKIRKILNLEEIDPFSTSFEDFIIFMKKNVKNKKDWENFIINTINENTAESTFVIEHINGKKYTVRGNSITDRHGIHVGRMAIFTEII